MKTFFRTFGLGALLTALFAVGGISAFAQDNCGDVDAINAAYQAILDTYKSQDLATFKKAIDNGKSFLEKYGTCEVAKDNATWVKNNLPKWEARAKDWETSAARKAVTDKYDAAIQSQNWDAAYTAADEFNAKFPNDDARINLIVPLAWIGFQQVGAKDNKYNAKAIANAKTAIELIKAGAKPKPSGGYGAFKYECTGKDECISFLTYTIGYITYNGDGNKKDAMPYYYEASKLPGSFKTNPVVYGTIGDFYYDTVKTMAADVKVKIADQKDTDTDEVKAKKDADIKQALGMLNGYAERAMDAYSRAYTLAKADPKTKAYSDSVYKQIQALYTVRFGGKQEGIDSWITTAVAKPFPDPTSTVTPVIDETTTNTTGGTGTGIGAANGSGIGAANGTGIGAANGNGIATSSAVKPAAPAAKTASTAKTIKPRK